MKISEQNKYFSNKLNIIQINFFIFILFIIPFSTETKQPYRTYFLDGFGLLATIYNDSIRTYSQNNELLYTLNFQNQIISSEEKNMISLSYIYNDNIKVLYMIAKNNIYSGTNYFTVETSNENITNRPSIIVPYNCENNNCTILISLIDSDKKLRIYKYQNICGLADYYYLNHKIIALTNSSSSQTSLSGCDYVSCQIMVYSEKKVYVCFYENSKKEIGTITLNLDTLEQDTLKPPILKRNSGAKNIKSVLFSDDQKAFICYINNNNSIACIIFDLNRNEFDKEYKYIESIPDQNYFSINYFKTKAQYFLTAFTSDTEIYYEVFYDQMNIVDNSYNGGKYCLTLLQISLCSDNNLPTAVISFGYGNYKITKMCQNENVFTFQDVSTTCNIRYDRVELTFDDTIDDDSKENLISEKYTEYNSLQSEFTNVKSEVKQTDSLQSRFSESESIILDNIFEPKINEININKTLENFINNIDEFIRDINFDEIYIIKGKGYSVKINPMNYNKLEKNFFHINFLECENKIRNMKKLQSNDNLTLITIEIDKNNELALTPQIEYLVFNGKDKLDLSVCNNDEIEIKYDIKNSSKLDFQKIIKFSEIGVDILNINDPFFNDICFPYYENNSDIILKDRISDIFQNYSFCDDNCKYKNIDYDTLLITCICPVRNVISSKIRPLRFDYILLDLLTNSSLGVIKCYNLVFNLNNKNDNIGFIILLLLLGLHIPIFIHYFKYTIIPVIKYILTEMKKYNYIAKFYNPIKKRNSKKNSTNSKEIYKGKSTSNNFIKSNQLINSNNNIIFNTKIEFNSFFPIKNRKKERMKSFDIFEKQKKINSNKIKKYLRNISFVTNKNEYYLIQINANNSLNNNPPESRYNLDNYTYEEAIKYDKRSFWSILFICIITKDNTLNLFMIKSPLEIKSLRICLFIFNISCDLSLNALFYFNENISDKYYYKGNNLYLFTLFNNISISIISSFLSLALIISLKFLTNSKDDIESLFREEEEKLRKDNKYYVSKIKRKIILIRIHEINRKLKIKIIFFILIEVLIMLFFCYFVTAFCEVYKMTQISWIIDSIISYVLSFPIGFLVSFLMAIFYVIAITERLKWLYKII